MVMSGHRVWSVWAALAVVLIAVCPPGARAQIDAPNAPVVGEVSIDLTAFGFAGARPGEWTGIRLRLLDQTDQQRTLLVRWHGWDQDGDTPFYERAIASNPGQPLSVWLYGRLPYNFTEATPIQISVHEGLDSGGGDEGSGYRAGRLLGRALTSLATSGGRVGRLTPTSMRRYAVVGSATMGLGRYASRSPGMAATANWSPLSHELTDVIAGLQPQDFPDRWMGLSSLDVIVWERGNPADLAGARSRALRRWIERGGHLVIVLPAAGQEWSRGVNNPLRDLLPLVERERLEGVDLEPFRELITGGRAVERSSDPTPLPSRSVVQAFRPLAQAEPNEAMPLLAGEDGTVVVTRRLVGVGAVTMIGLNLRAPSLASRGLPSTIAFWNRVLGRRGEFLSPDELSVEDRQNRKDLIGLTSRDSVVYDAGIGGLVSKTGSAAAGLLAGVALGVLYVAIAGPVGFALLRRFDQTKHAWLVFVLSAIAFTGAAWGTAAALRPKRIEGVHLTFLDHVYGQPIQRGRTWMGVLLPEYGEAILRVGDPELSRARDGDRAGAWDLIAPWEPLEIGTQGGFPDARGYPVWVAAPDTMAPPTRATVKRIQVDWAGGPRWPMPRPAEENSVRLRPRDVWDDGKGVLTGVLTHELPAPMTSVSVIVAPGQRNIGTLTGSQIISDARAFSIGNWAPGEALDLGAITAQNRGNEYLLERFMDNLTDRPRVFGTLSTRDVTTTPLRLVALALFGQLAPPTSVGFATGSSPIVAHRSATHGWDLDRWMTQPCLIIIGRVEAEGDRACPTPIHVGDDPDPIASTGTTIVRWVYPLRAAPPQYPVRNDPDTTNESEAE